MQVTAQGGASPATGHSTRGHGSSGGEQHATGLLCCQCRPASKSAVPCMRRQPGTVPLQAFSRAAPVLSCAVYWCSPLSVEPCCSGVGAGTRDRGDSACAACLVHCWFPSGFSCIEEAAELLHFSRSRLSGEAAGSVELELRCFAKCTCSAVRLSGASTVCWLRQCMGCSSLPQTFQRGGVPQADSTCKGLPPAWRGDFAPE